MFSQYPLETLVVALTSALFGAFCEYKFAVLFARHAEFNALADRLAIFFEAQRMHPSLNRTFPKQDVFLMARNFRGRRLAAFQAAMSEYAQATGDNNQHQDASGQPLLTDPTKPADASAKLVTMLARR